MEYFKKKIEVQECFNLYKSLFNLFLVFNTQTLFPISRANI